MACQVQHRVIGVLDTALTQLDATISSGENSNASQAYRGLDSRQNPG